MVRAFLLPTIAFLSALAVLISLGTWQVHRLQWKEELIARTEARLASAPISLSEVLTRKEGGEDYEYQPVYLEGEFDHANEQFFYATHNGAVGWYVYTPTKLSDGRWIFTNRGFVPDQLKAADKRQQGLLTGKQRIEGLARAVLTEKPSSIVPDNDLEKNVYHWKDVTAMTRNAGLKGDDVVPLFVDASKTEIAGGLPEGGVTLVSFPNNHLQYVITWYGLACALTGVFIFFMREQWRKRKASEVG